MAEHITRCPKCHTSFRVTDAHLKPAKGSVRCGSCLAVFNAIDHLAVMPQKEEPVKEQETKAETEEFLISDDMGIEQTNHEEVFSSEFTQNTSDKRTNSNNDSNLFERELIEEKETENQSADDSWALDLIKSESEDEEYTQPPEPEEEYEEIEESGVDYAAHYQTDKFQILEDEDDILEDFDDSQHLEAHFDDIDYGSQEVPGDKKNYQKNDSIAPGLSAQFLDSIEPEPVEFTWRTSGAWWNSNILWANLSILAGALLFFQYAWINMDKLSRDGNFRPYYVQACEILGCKLPTISDLSQVSARNLVIRENPNAVNSLVVDFILQNSAFFEQNFPPIELAFTDHTNQVVASRCFKPKEYLAGELKGRKLMPVRQPIHIALEIMHPGKSALGYKIAICP